MPSVIARDMAVDALAPARRDERNIRTKNELDPILMNSGQVDCLHTLSHNVSMKNKIRNRNNEQCPATSSADSPLQSKPETEIKS